MSDYELSRKRMVEDQLIPRGISDERVIFAMGKVPRHQFVSEAYRHEAYNDYPLPVGSNQTISQPYMVAIMTQLLRLKGDENVLEIGTGSGYQAAILAELAEKVWTVEIIEELAVEAKFILKKLGYDNIEFKFGDGYSGWEENAPYDGIIVTCGPSKIPEPLTEQLAEGGRLVIPVGSGYQTLTIVEKLKGELKYTESIDCRFVPMTRSKI